MWLAAGEGHPVRRVAVRAPLGLAGRGGEQVMTGLREMTGEQLEQRLLDLPGDLAR